MATTTWRFVHAADLHLDTSFSGLARIDQQVAARFREASLQSFQNLLDLTIAQGAQFLLLAGDLYDGRDRDLRAQRVIRDGIRLLASHGIDVFIVHGNHDPLTPEWRASLSQEPNLTIFGTQSPETVDVTRDGTVIATVTGMSFATSAVRDNLAQRFTAPVAPSAVSIALLHANVDGNAAHDAYAPCTRRELLDSGFDYWALGHVHTRQTWTQDGRYVAYPGNIQGRSFKPSELGPKGALVVEVVDGAVTEPRFVACDDIRLVDQIVECHAAIDALSLDDVIVGAVHHIVDANYQRPVVLRLRLSNLAPALAEVAVLGELRDQLNQSLSDQQPWSWIDQLCLHSIANDELQPSGFTQETLTELHRLMADPAALTRVLTELTGDIAEAHRRVLLDAANSLTATEAEADAVDDWTKLCVNLVEAQELSAQHTVAEVLQ
jgi:exonuclease SbcD